MKESSGQLTRRSVLGAAAVAGLAGCEAVTRGQSPVQPETSTRQPASKTKQTRAQSLGTAEPYVPLPDEVLPACKEAAASLLVKALTWDNAEGLEIARRINTDVLPGLAESLRPLLSDDTASRTSIVYPQYGGINAAMTKASVMVLARQDLLPPDAQSPRHREVIVDVRLTATKQGWSVTSASIGARPRASELTEEVRRLLRNRRITLPQPARLDLEAAQISPRLASLLNRLSNTWQLHVLVLKAGHPRNVFGTDRLSNHTRGRAVDIWAINGTPVIGAGRALWEPVVREAARLGATEVGAPSLPRATKGLAPVFFTNPTHQDHVHLGFEPDAN